MITTEQTQAMLEEYKKGGKFKDYVDKGCEAYGDSVESECQKTTVYEYYKSVTTGCNQEKGVEGVKKEQ